MFGIMAETNRRDLRGALRTALKLGATSILCAALVAAPCAHAGAQEAAPANPVYDATMDAATMSGADTWKTIGCVTGFLTGGIGGLIPVAIAYSTSPPIPPGRILGKDAAYVAAYSETFRDKASSARGKASVMGCLTGAALGYVIASGIVAAASL